MVTGPEMGVAPLIRVAVKVTDWPTAGAELVTERVVSVVAAPTVVTFCVLLAEEVAFALGDALGVALPVVAFPFNVLLVAFVATALFNVPFVVALVARVIVAHPAKKTVMRSRATSGEMSLTAFMMYLANSSFMVNTR